MEAVSNFFTPDYIVHLTDRFLKGGHEMIKDTLTTLRSSFPDIQVEIEIL